MKIQFLQDFDSKFLAEFLKPIFSQIFSQFFKPEKRFTYTRMKRKHWLNTQVGAIVGAIPPLMGYTAASGGSFGIEGTCVAAMLFFWQFPHYYALAANKNQDRVIPKRIHESFLGQT